MNKEDVTMAENDKDNMRVVYFHIQKVFNNHQRTDFSVLNLIKQWKTMWHLDDPISWN